jgi:hypothetical protein
MSGGRVDIACYFLALLISFAFGIPQDRIAGPDWMVIHPADLKSLR